MLVMGCLACVTHAASSGPAPAGISGDLRWRMIGPFRGGRTRSVAGVPSQLNVFYVGAVNGGVWKTEDAGRTWKPIFEDQPTQSIGAIAVAPSDANVIYAASGEGLHRPDLSVGDGIYRSNDAGRSWTHLGLADGQQIPELAIDAHNPNRLFAAVLGHPYGPNAQRGVFRSLDGGVMWQKVLYKDEDTGASAVIIDPSNPDIVYAALWQSRLGPWEDKNEFQGTGGGLFKSIDGGNTWKSLTNGFPKGLSQVNIAIAPSSPHRLYAEVGTDEPGEYSSSTGLGLYRSDDAGESWVRITTDPRAALRIGGGDLPVVRVDPSNADVVYSAGIVTVKSIDGGKTWLSLRGAPGGDDYQNLWISPNDSRVIALVSDQGAVISVNGGQSWSSWFNQPTAQLYHVSVTPTFPYRVCAGQQESGSLCIESRGNDGQITTRDWHPVGVIEYGYVAPDPLDPDVIYGAGRTEVSRYHWSTGQAQNVTPVPVKDPGVRADRTEPLLFSPIDPHTLYYAANKIYKTTDGGMVWQTISPDLTRESPGLPSSVGKLHSKGNESQRGAVYALAASPRSGGVLWAGTDDGLVWRTEDGGEHWSNVTPAAMTPWSKVTQIEASHFDAEVAYVTASRLRVDDLQPYIFRTRDGGKTWQSIGGGLPQSPVNAVREDTERKGLLFAATETAVWMSSDDGEHWDSLQLNLPHTSMRDLLIHDHDLILATHGRSIWILDDISRFRQIGTSTPRDAVLVQPAEAYHLRRSTWSDTPIPPDEPTGTNPPAGAVIDYFLPKDSKHALVLEVLDRKGELVRRYTSDDRPDSSAEELARELIPAYWIAPFRALSARSGMHRFVWDLRYAAPATTTRGYPISAVPYATPRGPEGPQAVPGGYIIRLTVDGKRLEAPLVLHPDPRVPISADAFKEQLRLSRQLVDSLNTSTPAVLSARSEREQLKDLAQKGPLPEAAKRFDGQLAVLLEGKEKTAEEDGDTKREKDEDAAPAPLTLTDVNGQLDRLYAEVGRADAAPTAAQISANDSAQKALSALLRRWQQLQATLPELNKVLRADKLAPVRADRAPARDLNAADED
jgi:photosystem II stability/assembly factor-like uncharacterized protein